MTNNLDISSLDFNSHREGLKKFLKGQAKFKDYDFDGSNMAVLLDLLSYNTFHNNFYNNMAIGEMFLDSAQLRNSITSHAKSLNYTPRSKRAASATIKVTMRVEDNSPFVVIPSRTVFTAPNTNRGAAKTFYTHDSHTIIPDKGIYTSDNIYIYEGTLVNEKFFASAKKEYIYPIGNPDIDTTTLKIFVTNFDGIEEEYVLATSLHSLDQKSNIYFLQLSGDTYEFYFGGNVFGKQPDIDSIIRIEYIVTSGEDANGICEFLATDNIQGYKVSRVLPVSPAYGGSDAETNESIKMSATKAYQIQDRAVTETDYSNMLYNNFPEVQAISVVGGEELNPPKFGNVFVYVDAKDMVGVSENTKEKIKNFIKPRMPLGITVNVETPNFFFFDVKSLVSYTTKNSPKSATQIQALTFNVIKEYIDTNLSTFGSKMRHSVFENYINESDISITSNVTDVRVYAERALNLNTRNDFTIRFGIPLTPISDYAYRAFTSENPNVASLPDLQNISDRPPTVSTSFFKYNNLNVYIRDNGTGILQIVRQSGNREIIVNKNVGSVNYQTGVIRINKLIIQSYTGSGVKFYVVPKSRDFSIPKNSIISIRNEDLKVTVKTD